MNIEKRMAWFLAERMWRPFFFAVKAVDKIV